MLWALDLVQESSEGSNSDSDPPISVGGGSAELCTAVSMQRICHPSAKARRTPEDWAQGRVVVSSDLSGNAPWRKTGAD